MDYDPRPQDEFVLPPANPWKSKELAELLNEARRWEGTPHRDRMAKPGVGIDCLFFLRELAVFAGVLPPFQMPFYRPIWGVGREFNVIERVLLTCCHAVKLDPAEPLQDGDAVIFTVGKQSNHVALVLDGMLWHSVADQGVTADPLTTGQPWQSVVRLTAPGFIRRPETLTAADLKP